jgi:glycerol uptake facilitator-like aquaporin
MDRRLVAPLTAEVVGTFLFFFVGAGSVVLNDYLGLLGGSGPGLLGVALAHGLVLGVLVSGLGAVSGGHFNPAVTFGVWITGKIAADRAVAYVIAQLAGAVLAGHALRAIFTEAAWRPSMIGTPALGTRGPRRSAAWGSAWRSRPTS